MKIQEFKGRIQDINNSSYSYGNDILYSMGKNPNDLKDQIKLSGAIWLIGRAYAASPQRRSYGKTATGDKYNDINGTNTIRPIWPVKTQNDGREGFFVNISKEISKDISEEIASCHLVDLINNYSNDRFSYAFDYVKIEREKDDRITALELNQGDEDLLIQSVAAVLSFNQILSKAIEIFDQVPKNNEFKGEKVKSNNHLSFSSKFLHFYFPNITFIIDSYAYNGGCALLSGNEKNWRYIIDSSDSSQYFEKDVYTEIQNSGLKNDIITCIVNKIEEKLKVMHTDVNNGPAIRDDAIGSRQYIIHCVRSYLLGVFLKKNDIKPCPHIASDHTFCPMPRLTDAIFLNIKKPFTKKEVEYENSLRETFYNQVSEKYRR